MNAEQILAIMELVGRRMSNPPEVVIAVVEIVRRAVTLLERVPPVVFLVIADDGSVVAAYRDIEIAKQRALRAPGSRVRKVRIQRTDTTPAVVVEGDDEASE